MEKVIKEIKIGTRLYEKLPSNNTGLAGEYFVAAELYRRGYSVGMTIGNAKAVDLFAERNGKVHQIQVKSIRSKDSIGWPVMRDSIKQNVMYVLVNLNYTDHPDYYILTPAELLSHQKQYRTRGIADLRPIKRNGSFSGRWDKIK